MKGVVLAGGTGSRMLPLTKITNKHLLPIYDKPMIYYPIQTLVDAGIREILVVTGGRNSGDFLRLLANGREFGLKHLDYTYQEGEGGIADALGWRNTLPTKAICVILGDNIIQDSIRHVAEEFERQASGAKILLKQVHDAERFGVAEIRDGRIVGIEEKPQQPKSNMAVTGIYMYDETVFEKVRKLVPSGRGELEITDVNNAYVDEGTMTYANLEGWWTDAGTFDSLLRAGNLVAGTRKRNEQPGWRAVRAGAGNAGLRKGHRQSDRGGRFERPDCGRARLSVCGVAGRSRLFSGSGAHGARADGSISEGHHTGLGSAELSRDDQGISFSPAADRLLGSGGRHAASGLGGFAAAIGHVRRPQHDLSRSAAPLAVIDPAGSRAWL